MDGDILKVRSELPQERVKKELQTTIPDCITRDGMGQDKSRL
jgi:hypothetical protein